MWLGFGENGDELFLVLVRNVIIPDQVKKFDGELFVVLLIALFCVLGDKGKELALLVLVILQAELIAEVAEDAEGRVISKLSLAIVIDLIKDISMDLLVNLHESWQPSHIFRSDEVINGSLLKLTNLVEDLIGDL